MNILEFLNQIKFGPEYGDWSGAIVAIVFGFLSLFVSVFSGVIIYLRWKKENRLMRLEQTRLIKAEEAQNYLRLRQRYDEIWDKLTHKGLRHLYMSYGDNKELKKVFEEQEIGRIKTYTWQLINLLSDIEFFYCRKQDSLYWKRWEAIFQFVFDKPFIKMAFVKNRKDFQVNSSFVQFVEELIKSQKEIKPKRTNCNVKFKEAS